MKVAIVHEWLTTYGGSETFVELWLRMYPQADIFTLVYDKKGMKGHFEGVKIYTSKLQKLPFATKIYTKLLKFMPRAFESFDLNLIVFHYGRFQDRPDFPVRFAEA